MMKTKKQEWDFSRKGVVVHPSQDNTVVQISGLPLKDGKLDTEALKTEEWEKVPAYVRLNAASLTIHQSLEAVDEAIRKATEAMGVEPSTGWSSAAYILRDAMPLWENNRDKLALRCYCYKDHQPKFQYGTDGWKATAKAEAKPLVSF